MAYYTSVQRCARRFPLVAGRIEAGFPSPADDHLEGELDLNELLVTQRTRHVFRAGAG